ncbi:MAG: PD-(D/E)XK nuclease family protein [Peptococcaceae bacterium]|nr:PD-(D/E)XK nuclease family protein [Peptococcaceae bacterium]
MPLRLILGRAGAGKTAACIREISARLKENPDKQYLLITPEQATFISEKRLLSAFGGAGGFSVRVLSFRRFVHFVLQEKGEGLAPVLDATGKSLILRSILEERRDELKSYRRVWQKQGFLEQLISLMDELRSYRIGPDELERCLAAGDQPWKGFGPKLEDIRLIYTAYLETLEAGWLDFPGQLSLLCEKLRDWPLLRETEFWLDGFHGFTPAEYQVIETLLTEGRPVALTLNLPAGAEKGAMAEENVFYPPWETARDLQSLCREKGLELEPPLYLGEPVKSRFIGSPVLAGLEEFLSGQRRALSPMLQEEAAAAAGEALAPLTLSYCANMTEEVERLAREILAAARSGLRFRNMAVLLRDPKAYESLFQSIFPIYDIPYFFDGPKTLSYHPLAALLLNLTPFLEGRYQTANLLAYLKTGLTGFSDNQADLLENYCLAYGVQRQHWESRRPWRFTPADDPDKEKKDRQADLLRRRLFAPLAEMQKELASSASLLEMLTAVYRLLEKLRVPEQLTRLARQALEAGDPGLAALHRRAWQEVMKLLDQTAAFLGTKPPDPRFLAGVLSAGLENLEIAAVPPALDQVTVSSMDRSRTPEMDLVWILGVNEGILPSRGGEEGLFLTEERKWLNRQGLNLAPDSERKLFSESYLIYIALTRAGRGLRLSASRADNEGKSLAPSPLFYSLSRLFPGIKIQEGPEPEERTLCRPRPALRQLALAMQKADAEEKEARLWPWLYQWFSRRPEFAPELSAVTRGWALEPLGRQLPADLAERLFGRIIKTSITRLEQFQACPFAHFLAYGLKLSPRQEYEVRPPEIGNFFHDSLEALLKESREKDRELSSLSEEQLDLWVDLVVEKQLAEKSHEIFLTSAWYRTLSLRLSRILHSAARAMAFQEGQGRFRPLAMEAAFGMDRPDSLAPLRLDLGGGREILLRGRIDRIDRFCPQEGGAEYLRIVDYKSGFQDLQLWQVYYGLKLQLVLYLEAALASRRDSRPAGMFYFQMKDPVVKAANSLVLAPGGREELARQGLKEQKLRGYLLRDKEIAAAMDRDFGKSLFLPVSLLQSGEFSSRSNLCSAEEFRLLGDYSRSLLRQAGKRLMAGDIRLSPYKAGRKESACTYCDYRAVCRFDPSISGHRYRNLLMEKDTEIWPLMRKEVDSGEKLE